MTKSVLDDIEGIGPRRKKLLLESFGSVAALSRATAEEIAAVKGIGSKAAQAVYRALHSQDEIPGYSANYIEKLKIPYDK